VIAIVYQELNMVPTLNVAENLFPARLPVNAFGMVRYRELYRNAERAIEKLSIDIDPHALVGNLSIAHRQPDKR
jgi:D-xylose transport system ATP-binding protein